MVEDEDLDDFAAWAWEANAILFLPDGTVRDPSGNILVDPGGGQPDPEAIVPYPVEAQERRQTHIQLLHQKGVSIPPFLPPVVGFDEVQLRAPAEVARRMMALVVVAIRAEGLASGTEIQVSEIRSRFPVACQNLSPEEETFFEQDAPAHQDVIQFVWRYEALTVLLWALGLLPELPFPDIICDVPQVVKTALDQLTVEFPDQAQLRPVTEILDSLDLHYCLHWITTQARLNQEEPPVLLEPGVISERHYALNWLIQFENRDWDNVQTPT